MYTYQRFSSAVLLLGNLAIAPSALAHDLTDPHMHPEHLSTAMEHGEHGHVHQQPATADHSSHRMPAQGAITRTTASYDIPDLALISADGERIPLQAALGDTPVMLNFIFTSCTTICPPMSATFAAVQQKLAVDGLDVRMVSISIDPEYDTPARLQEYAKRFQARPGWQFFTGTVDDSVTAQRAFDVYRGSKMNHAPTTLLRAAPGEPWVRIEGFASASDLVKEVHMLVHGHVAQGM